MKPTGPDAARPACATGDADPRPDRLRLGRTRDRTGRELWASWRVFRSTTFGTPH